MVWCVEVVSLAGDFALLVMMMVFITLSLRCYFLPPSDQRLLVWNADEVLPPLSHRGEQLPL